MQLLRRGDELKRKRPAATIMGRANDARLDDNLNAPGEVVLEYRDAKGRLLTPKEAFRLQCYAFHGFKPGKKALDRRERQFAVRQAKSLKGADTPLGAVAALKKKLKDTKSAYVTLG